VKWDQLELNADLQVIYRLVQDLSHEHVSTFGVTV